MNRYQEIAPIQTRYKGYHFRSRLEARWAVFFEEIEAKFEYEYQDFMLPSGRYLPDFFLPEVFFSDYDDPIPVYAEVKPSFTQKERVKCVQLSRITKRPVLLLCGVPDFKEVEYVFWHEGYLCGSTGLFCGGNYTNSLRIEPCYYETDAGMVTEYDIERLNDDFKRAVYESRAARF